MGMKKKRALFFVIGLILLTGNIVACDSIDSDVLPIRDDTYDIGSPSLQWQDGYFSDGLFIDGVAVSVSGDPEVQTIQPAAAIRVSELTAAGITVAEIASGTIEMSGAVWRILSPLPRPSPAGESDGELWLILVEN